MGRKVYGLACKKKIDKLPYGVETCHEDWERFLYCHVAIEEGASSTVMWWVLVWRRRFIFMWCVKKEGLGTLVVC